MKGTVLSLLRFAVFNPCSILVLLVCIGIYFHHDSRRPPSPFDPDLPVEVIGWICAPVERTEDYDYLQVAPVEMNQQGLTLRKAPGRIALYVRKTPSGTLGNLLYGDLVRFNTCLETPSHFDTPGVLDYRDYLWHQGFLHVARLKSPLQLSVVPAGPHRPLLRPLFGYAAAFEQHCREHLPHRQAQFVLSLFLGRGKALQEFDIEDLKRLGILHIFVVSGSHVSLVLLYLHFLFRRLGLVGNLACLAGVWAYVVIVGCTPPVLRSGIMATTLYILISAGLRRQFLNGLSLSALLLLIWNPVWLRHSSFQLSYLSLYAIGLLVLPTQDRIRPFLSGIGAVFSSGIVTACDHEARVHRRIRYSFEDRLTFLPPAGTAKALKLVAWLMRGCADVVLCSWMVPLLLLPVCLYYSNLWPWTQGFSNILLVPLFGAAVPLCLLLFMLFWVPGSGLLSWATGKYGELLLDLIDALADIAWVDYFKQPTLGMTLGYLVFFPGAWLLLKRRKWLAFLAPVLLLLVLAHNPHPTKCGVLSLTMLDVGQSESLHIRYPDGSDALIDTGGSLFGTAGTGDFIGQRVVSRYLWSQDIHSLRYVLLTHNHADHVGGFDFVSRAFPIQLLLYGTERPEYRRFPARALQAGETFVVSNVVHRVLHPDPSQLRTAANTNDESVVLALHYGRFSILLPGDIEAGVERRIADSLPEITVLKAAHHGGRHSNSLELLQVTNPALALISAGRKNPFGHPSHHTLARLQDLGICALCTCDLGSIRIETDGLDWWLSHYSGKTRRFETLEVELQNEVKEEVTAQEAARSPAG